MDVRSSRGSPWRQGSATALRGLILVRLGQFPLAEAFVIVGEYEARFAVTGVFREDFPGPLHALLVVAVGEHPAGELTLKVRVVGRVGQAGLDLFALLVIATELCEERLLACALIEFPQWSQCQGSLVMGIAIEGFEEDRPIEMGQGAPSIIVPEVELGALEVRRGILRVERQRAVEVRERSRLIAKYEGIASGGELACRIVGMDRQEDIVRLGRLDVAMGLLNWSAIPRRASTCPGARFSTSRKSAMTSSGSASRRRFNSARHHGGRGSSGASLPQRGKHRPRHVGNRRVRDRRGPRPRRSWDRVSRPPPPRRHGPGRTGPGESTELGIDEGTEHGELIVGVALCLGLFQGVDVLAASSQRDRGLGLEIVCLRPAADGVGAAAPRRPGPPRSVRQPARGGRRALPARLATPTSRAHTLRQESVRTRLRRSSAVAGRPPGPR